MQDLTKVQNNLGMYPKLDPFSHAIGNALKIKYFGRPAMTSNFTPHMKNTCGKECGEKERERESI